jgi:hypothetical protein
MKTGLTVLYRLLESLPPVAWLRGEETELRKIAKAARSPENILKSELDTCTIICLACARRNQHLQWRLHSLHRDSFAAGRKSSVKYDYRSCINAAWSLFTVAQSRDLISLQTSRNNIGRSYQVDCGLIKVCPDVPIVLEV